MEKRKKPKIKVSKSFKKKKKEISPMRFTFLIVRKIDKVLDNETLDSEQKVTLIKYYMNKYREEDAKLESLQ